MTVGSASRWLIGCEIFMSISGIFGGVWMISHPTTMMPLDLLNRTPFGNWFWPGIALLVFVGVGPLLAQIAEWLRLPIAHPGHFIVGWGMVAWILLEMSWLFVFLPLQLPYLIIGIAIVEEARRSGHAYGHHVARAR